MSLESLVNDAVEPEPQEESDPLGTDLPATATEDPTEDSPAAPVGEQTPFNPLSGTEDDKQVSPPGTPTGETTTEPVKDNTAASADQPTEPEKPQDDILNAILNRIAPVKSKQRRRKLKVLIYSDPGCGKSVLAGTAPDNLFIDAEDGLISLDNHPDLIPDTVYAYPYKSFIGFEAMVQKLNENPPELAHIKTVTIDTISELHKKGLQEITEREWAKSPMANNRYVAETDHHMENNEHIRRLVSSLRDLDRNLILLSHARTVEPKGKPAKTYPDFSEKLANTLAGIVDIVGYMYLKEVDGEVVRVLKLQGDGIVIAKTRIGGYPDEIVNPTWSSLWDAFLKASEAHESHQ